MHRSHWDEFYGGVADSAVVQDPSPFARWVRDQHDGDGRLIDVGTGTGRDGLWFAANGFDVVGLDYSPASISLATRRAEQQQVKARFEELDLYDVDAVHAAAKSCAGPGATTVYARFLVHAIEDEGRANLFELARTATEGGTFYLEFRTGKDAGKQHVFGEHFRLYLDGQQVVDELEGLGAEVLHHEEGHGLAVYQEEDPHVARLAVRWS
jgi:SAM-dependent methyltransferase